MEVLPGTPSHWWFTVPSPTSRGNGLDQRAHPGVACSAHPLAAQAHPGNTRWGESPAGGTVLTKSCTAPVERSAHPLATPRSHAPIRWSARSRRRGRTTLTLPSGGADWQRRRHRSSCWTGSGRRCSHRGPQEVAEVWQVRLPRHLFVPPVGAHDAIVATTTVGLNQFSRPRNGVLGSCRSSSSPAVVVSEPVTPPPRVG